MENKENIQNDTNFNSPLGVGGSSNSPFRGQGGISILVFDNYDSFTYNLVHLVEKITHEKVDVFRNDEIALEEVNKYDKII